MTRSPRIHYVTLSETVHPRFGPQTLRWVACGRNPVSISACSDNPDNVTCGGCLKQIKFLGIRKQVP